MFIVGGLAELRTNLWMKPVNKLYTTLLTAGRKANLQILI